MVSLSSIIAAIEEEIEKEMKERCTKAFSNQGRGPAVRK
jgi:hypothetical protein